jgi:Arc/MetJ-type ribon-helix-helix transcriptional regulator
MSKMITLRMPDDRVAAIDALVASTDRASRTAFIVEAIDKLVAQLESERIDREIVDGYTRIPPTEEEIEWARWSGARSVREEPW